VSGMVIRVIFMTRLYIIWLRFNNKRQQGAYSSMVCGVFFLVIVAPFYLRYRKRTVELTSAALIKLHLDFKVLLDKL